MTKFIVNIEQPLCKGFEIWAEDEDHALEIAKAQYSMGQLVLNNDDLGTGPQFQVCDEEGGELTEWSD